MMCRNNTIFCSTETLVKKDEIPTMYPMLGVLLVGLISFTAYYCYKNYFIREKPVLIKEESISALNENKQQFRYKKYINTNIYDKNICKKFDITLEQYNEIKIFLKDLRLEFDSFAIKEKDFKLILSQLKDSDKAAKLQADFNITKIKFNKKLNFLNNISELKFGTNMHELTQIMDKINIKKKNISLLIKKINFDYYQNLGLTYSPYSLQMTLDAV
jgi:hypothetical protein